jgi:hypothetical protein
MRDKYWTCMKKRLPEDFRRMATAAGLAMFPGERKVASAIIASAHQHLAPERPTLGRTPMRLLTKPSPSG